MTSFTHLLDQLLAENGLTLPALARLADIPETRLRLIHTHGDPTLSEMQRLATALRVPLARLLPTALTIAQAGLINQAGTGNQQQLNIHYTVVQGRVQRQASRWVRLGRGGAFLVALCLITLDLMWLLPEWGPAFTEDFPACELPVQLRATALVF